MPEEIKSAESKSIYVALGAVAIALASVGVNVATKTEVREVTVAASESVDDMAVTGIVGENLEIKDCVKQSVILNGNASEGWLCNGGYDARQEWLDGIAEGGKHVRLTPRREGDTVTVGVEVERLAE